MGKGKTRLRKIESATSRQVTFSKRRNGLLKKAYELSVLCDAELGLIVLSPRGKVYEFSSTCMQKMLERYDKCSEGSKTTSIAKEQDLKDLKRELANMEERIEILECTQRKMLGEELASCALKDLNQLESQVERGLRNIRARKNEILVTQIEQLQRKATESSVQHLLRAGNIAKAAKIRTRELLGLRVKFQRGEVILESILLLQPFFGNSFPSASWHSHFSVVLWSLHLN